MRLDAEKAPLTVANFRNYVACGQYDLTIFHQVLKGPLQIVLGGGYTTDLKEKADVHAHSERGPQRLEEPPRHDRHGPSSQRRRQRDVPVFHQYRGQRRAEFPVAHPRGYGYCVFGEVIEGMDVVDQIAKVPVHDSGKIEGLPVEAVVVKSIRQVK